MLTLGKSLLLIGLVLFVSGGIIYLLARTGINPVRMPGNLRLEWGNFTCVIALGASILLSILLTIILNVLARVLYK